MIFHDYYAKIDPREVDRFVLYRGALAQLAAVRLSIQSVRPKFKLGQNRPPEARQKIIAHLRDRGRPNDARAADALQSTLDP